MFESMKLPQVVLYLPSQTNSKALDRYVEEMAPKFKILQDICKKNTEVAQQRSKLYHDRTLAHPPHFEENEHVLLYEPASRKVGYSKKMTIYWKGPYRIIKKINDHVVILLDLKSLKTTIPVNIERLKRYVDREQFEDDWAQNILKSSPPGVSTSQATPYICTSDDLLQSEVSTQKDNKKNLPDIQEHDTTEKSQPAITLMAES
jgi:hypothetical protein